MFEHLAGRTPRIIDQDRARQFAVVAPYLPETGELVFEVRSQKLNRQPGEICFPGGRVEPGETPLQAGVRETAEELLVRQDQVEVVAPLDLLLRSEGSTVYPIIANLHRYAFTYNADEVEEVFTVPFDFFLSTQPTVSYNRVTMQPEEPELVSRLLKVSDYPWSEGRHSVLYYPYQNRMIWGMTAKIVHNLVTCYKEAL